MHRSIPVENKNFESMKEQMEKDVDGARQTKYAKNKILKEV